MVVEASFYGPVMRVGTVFFCFFFERFREAGGGNVLEVFQLRLEVGEVERDEMFKPLLSCQVTLIHKELSLESILSYGFGKR